MTHSLAEIKAAAEAATWSASDGSAIWRQGRKVGRTLYLQRGPEPSDSDPLIGTMDRANDAAFIALSREAVPWLVERCEELAEALRIIADDDDLVNANEDAFSVHAFRRCQQIARAALARLEGE